MEKMSMKHTEKYLQAKWVIENPNGYDERDVIDANKYCNAYLEGYNHALHILNAVGQNEQSVGYEESTDNKISKTKTVKQWFESLPNGYRERALANTAPEAININCTTLSAALPLAFHWKNTPKEEGFKFWKAIYDWSFGYGELPPLPEEK